MLTFPAQREIPTQAKSTKKITREVRHWKKFCHTVSASGRSVTSPAAAIASLKKLMRNALYLLDEPALLTIRLSSLRISTR
jgi:hypothetical protein